MLLIQTFTGSGMPNCTIYVQAVLEAELKYFECVFMEELMVWRYS